MKLVKKKSEGAPGEILKAVFEVVPCGVLKEIHSNRSKPFWEKLPERFIDKRFPWKKI